MIGKAVFLLVVLGAALAEDEGRTSLVGVDPDTLSCDPSGQVFLLLPHFVECSKFYMCAHGNEVEFSCSGGLIFDFELQTCNWQWATRCWLRTRLEDEIEGSGGYDEASGDFEMFTKDDPRTQAQPIGAVASPTGVVRTVHTATNGAAPTVQEKHFTSLLNCNDAAAAARQLPYKGDCQRYWRCIDNLPQAAYCSDGLFFNSKTQQCDFESNVTCELNVEDELAGEYIVY